MPQVLASYAASVPHMSSGDTHYYGIDNALTISPSIQGVHFQPPRAAAAAAAEDRRQAPQGDQPQGTQREEPVAAAAAPVEESQKKNSKSEGSKVSSDGGDRR